MTITGRGKREGKKWNFFNDIITTHYVISLKDEAGQKIIDIRNLMELSFLIMFVKPRMTSKLTIRLRAKPRGMSKEIIHIHLPFHFSASLTYKHTCFSDFLPLPKTFFLFVYMCVAQSLSYNSISVKN